MTIVPDASIAVELLLRTPLGENLARRLKGATLVAPALIDCEVLAVLRKLVLRNEVRDDRASAALDDLSLWQVRRLAGTDLLREAWSLRQNVSAYDAFYVAAARLYNAQVLTADGPLARAPRLGVVIENIRL
ncbi:MAG: type II toxin-antitoxin system VapC family toxin [Deltaproteobacteria bacterium]|nr:type II toxin-antitoxin system VapC family toxin [Deltaproteobacteria bacterium]